MNKGKNNIFKSCDDWWNNAIINLHYDKWDLYAEGYKLAAELLFEKVSEAKSNQDYLVYPIVFLTRHYIELRLKEIILKGKKLLDKKKEKPPTHHDLSSLWFECEKLIIEIWPNDSKKDLNETRKIK
ncbi:MAG: hypothetical protein IIA88_08445 [Bacteroidetes bacterium]|nr:hypothetical protein [Bacteroidota bacterium]